MKPLHLPYRTKSFRQRVTLNVSVSLTPFCPLPAIRIPVSFVKPSIHAKYQHSVTHPMKGILSMWTILHFVRGGPYIATVLTNSRTEVCHFFYTIVQSRMTVWSLTYRHFNFCIIALQNMLTFQDTISLQEVFHTRRLSMYSEYDFLYPSLFSVIVFIYT